MFRSPDFRIFAVLGLATAMSGCAAPDLASKYLSVPTRTAEERVAALQTTFGDEVPAVVTFDFDSSDLDAEALDTLKVQAEWIIDHPNARFSISGHTDRVGSNDYNYALGVRRAQSVLDQLVDFGVDPDQLEAMVSMGENAPLVDTEDQEAANRRTVTEVLEVFLVLQEEPGGPDRRDRRDRHRESDEGPQEPENQVLDTPLPEVGSRQDTDEDDNNGHGNDEDGHDSSNPGNSNDESGPSNGSPQDTDSSVTDTEAPVDDGNNGHGNDEGGYDPSNPGKSGPKGPKV